ncbi:hypothetical protein TNIN_48201 [Trichonephila inaurata madagascariensis]|uniref:Uncharacterized protein n=1 Tax=Trichonephila inaurata madagascariensis TaxID=2747483 RepID=A0A8X6YIX4_9ARAC|nr:hypothetical protein TNIN_48201 [Trichonephila inaurata madagascariensis]
MCHHRLMWFATPPICQSWLGLLRRRNKLNASVTYEAGACKSHCLRLQGVQKLLFTFRSSSLTITSYASSFIHYNQSIADFVFYTVDMHASSSILNQNINGIAEVNKW